MYVLACIPIYGGRGRDFCFDPADSQETANTIQKSRAKSLSRIRSALKGSGRGSFPPHSPAITRAPLRCDRTNLSSAGLPAAQTIRPCILAEYLFCKAFGWKQADNSQANVDAIGSDGTRYQIKSRRLTRFNKSRQLSAIPRYGR